MHALGLVSVAFAWQAWDNVHCQGVGCTPWRPLGLRLFCVAGVGQCALPRGRMYALASLGSPPLLRGKHGKKCALPRGRMYALASLGSPPLLRGRRGTMCIAKGSDVCPGVPWVSASFAWQAWDNVPCQGVGCTPWRPLGLRLFCVAGVGQCALPRGRMYALASLGSLPLLRGRRGTMCIAKGSDVRPGVPWVSASFAWQAWDNVHCQGVGCTPWRPLGLRLFCVANMEKNVHCQGVGCTPWRPLGLRLFCLAGVGQCALPRGRMYALASLGSPPLLRGRRGTMCIAKGSDVRPRVPWVSASFAWQAWDNVHCQGVGCTPWRPLGLRLFCVAGVGQCALPRGRMSPWRPLGSASFAWQAWGNVPCQGVGCRPGVPWAPPLLRGRRGTMLFLCGTHSLTDSLTHSPVHAHTYTHTCSEISYRITVVECIGRAQTIP